jgi:two-component system, cell cycle sensor histidine kinase and response regulator CckA
VVSALAGSSSRTTVAELRRSQKLEAMGRLVGGVVHDFNNLLTCVVLCCDLLLGELEKESPLRRYAQEMRSAGAQGAVLIEQLMAMVRQSQVEPMRLSFNEVVGNMQGLLARLAGESIELTAKLGDSLHLVEIDLAGSQQIILNLVLNARDAMPEGGQISLSTRNCVPGPPAGESRRGGTEDWVEFEVADTGCGMDEEVQAHIFEPFFTTKKVGQGIGLGLATVRTIVKQYHGTIKVESQPGQGTRITVGFPGLPAGEENNFPLRGASL